VDEDDAREFRDVTSPRTITEEINGIVTSKTFYAYNQTLFGDRIVITERAASQDAEYGDPGNIRTTSEYYEENPGALTSDKIKTSQSSDGLMTTYEYVYGDYVEGLNPGDGVFTEGSGSYVRTLVTQGTVDNPEGIANKTTRSVSIANSVGNTLYSASQVFDGSAYQTIQWTEYSYDELGRAVRTDNSDGTYTETHWSCCAVESQTDATGVSTYYTLDDLKRPYMVTREGLNGDVTTTKTMDALGRTLSTTTEAGSLSQASSTIYDTAGRVASSTNQAGLVTTYAYENAGRTQTVTQPGGATRTTTRHLDGRTISTTGTAVTPQYYEYGVEDDGIQWTKVYTGSAGSAMWSKSYTDFLGRTIKTERPAFGGGTLVAENFYDEHGRLIRSSAPGRADSLYVYDELGNQTWSGLDVDGDGELTAASMDRLTESASEYAYISGDWWQESKQIIYAEANSAEQTETGVSRSRLTGLGAGLVGESVNIDMHGNQTTSLTTLDRDAHTQTREVDYPDSTINAISTSEYGLTVSSTDKTGLTYTFDYDAFGRRISATDPRTGTSTTHYDEDGRVDYVQDADGNTSRFYYDAETGRKIADENALGHFVRYAYNLKGQLVRQWGDATYPVEYGYDAYGRKTSMKTFRSTADFDGDEWPSDAGDGDATTWIYDEATGLLIQKLDDEYKGATYAYSAEGKLLTRTWARTDQGQPLTTTYDYDPATGEMILTDYSDSTPDIAFEYDRLGRQTSVTDGSGARTFTYNDYLQPESEAITGTVQAVITRAYDAMGRNAGFSTDADYALAYGYDGFGRFETVQYAVEGVAGSASYGYLANSGLLESVTMLEDGAATAVTTTYGYEPHRNVKTLVANQYGTEIISEYGYGYDALGRRTSVTNSGNAFDDQAFNLYEYNARNELTASNRYLGTSILDTASPVDDEARAYNYDPIGNRIAAQQDYDISTSAPITSTYVTNSLNQYESVTSAGESISLDYDDDGNLIHKDGVQYVFNCENRLVEVSPLAPVIGDTRVTFAYDYMGRRYQKQSFIYASGEWSLVSTSTSLWDGWNRIQEKVVLASDGSEEMTSYAWGLDLSQSLQGAGGVGGLIAVVDNDSAVDFYLYDANGNVGQLISAADGTINAHYEYDPFGRLLKSTGSKANQNPYRFSTKPMDQQTGLYYYGYRYLDVDLGRWVSRDPIEEDGGFNLYAFDNNTVNKYDVFGLWGEDVHRDRTIEWAQEVNITKEIADRIGEADIAIDTLHAPTVISNDTWGWHFNRSREGDSRLTHRDENIELARKACDNETDDPNLAAQYIGWALHPDQDWVAHGDYNRIQEAPTLQGAGFFERRFYWHNWGLPRRGSTGMPDDANMDADNSEDNGRATISAMRGPNGGHRTLSNGDVVFWVSYHSGNRRFNLTRTRTKKILQDFKSYVETQENACECRNAFGVTPCSIATLEEL
jgi:RHS repeat-associated protein